MIVSEHELLLHELEDAIVVLESQLSSVSQDTADPERVLAQLVFAKLAILEARRDLFLHEQPRTQSEEPLAHVRLAPPLLRSSAPPPSA
jgi:hypothetical protein